MRSLVNGKKIILKNDTTKTGGTVLTASSLAKQTQGVACVVTLFITLLTENVKPVSKTASFSHCPLR